MDHSQPYLLRALLDARMEFKSAKEDFRSVKQRLNDPGLEQASRASFDEALKACDQAYEKYQRALIAFNERILTWGITQE